ncbi:hypothetical protein Tcan_13499 [Toxocara canis]|uniref:Uncharacterized protein n=1 Tax=Toxocara canis TaxID=6265 RepID=A0A0B2VPR6_TOXCA|nr:hypothetical protein Tcan_13498 [Toxocara canis]KHN83329.1 hypothetical protein Tcan_13499 [Toxocara canis]
MAAGNLSNSSIQESDNVKWPLFSAFAECGLSGVNVFNTSEDEEERRHTGLLKLKYHLHNSQNDGCAQRMNRSELEFLSAVDCVDDAQTRQTERLNFLNFLMHLTASNYAGLTWTSFQPLTYCACF